MSDRFKKWLGKIPIEVADEKMDLDVRLEDTEELMSIIEVDTKNVNMKEMNAIFLRILIRTYPEESQDALKAFLMRNSIQFMEKFMIGMGWAKEGQFQEAAKKETNL